MSYFKANGIDSDHRSGWGFGFSILPYGDIWRASRRIFTKYFNPSNPSINQPCEIIYVRRFLGQLLQNPSDFLQHTRTYVLIYDIRHNHTLHFLRISLVGSTTLSMTYSINVRPYNDPYIKIAEEAVASLSDLLVGGAFLVDIIPILKYVPEWFPGAKFQSKAATLRKQASMIRNATFAATEELMVCNPLAFPEFSWNYLMIRSQASGDYDPSFVTEALRKIQHSPDKDTNLLKDVAAMAYVGELAFYMPFLFSSLDEQYPGGADTTASALGTFFLAMVCYPNVQKEAQAELDKVLNGRLPEHSDIASLPYFSALIKEVYRYAAAFFKHSFLQLNVVLLLDGSQ